MPEIALPPLPLGGGCQCGAIRYEIGEAPAAFYICHCRDCQRQSGSAFGQSLQVHTKSLRVTGTPATFARQAASGRSMHCLYCPDCGTRLWHVRAEGSPFVSLKAGTLDDPDWLRPCAEIFTDRRRAWVKVTPAPPLTYPGQPDMEEMRAAFARMLA
ncbi:GFA family protein [Roseivivax sp.]